MNAVSFRARDAAHAVEQIHARLGSDAVVLSVGQVPASGFGRLWRRPQLEVLAGVPDPTPPPAAKPAAPSAPVEPADAGPTGLGGAWRSAGILHQLGLLPLYVDKVLDRVRASHGDTPPAALLDELALVRAALTGFWRPAARAANGSPVDSRVHRTAWVGQDDRALQMAGEVRPGGRANRPSLAPGWPGGQFRRLARRLRRDSRRAGRARMGGQ